MSQVLQVLEVFDIYIFQIFTFFWTPKLTGTLVMQPTEHGGDVNNNKLYLKIAVNWCKQICIERVGEVMYHYMEVPHRQGQ